MTKKKLPPNAVEHTHVAWGWEFLRRNPEYRLRYERWLLRTWHVVPLPSGAAKLLRQIVERTGKWQPRFEPWLAAAVEAGSPFGATAFFLMVEGKWVEVDGALMRSDSALCKFASRPDTLIAIQADRLLDPMEFALNRWLEPALDSDAYGDDVLREAFDVHALTSEIGIDTGSMEADALRSLGMLTVEDLGTKIEFAPHRERVIIASDGGAASRPRVTLEFDLTAPIDAQIGEARRKLSNRRSQLAENLKPPVPELVDVHKPDQANIYKRYLALLDVEEHIGEVQSASELYRALVNHERLREFPLTCHSVEKNLKQARFLRDHGYRQVAFLPERADP
ncbi:MAG: hypothetical protein JWQ07_1249 [Ramlibacter sp.]|nr:hypothetical protein [Ramlibacter sp.]